MGFNSGFKGLSWYELNNEIGTDDLVRGLNRCYSKYDKCRAGVNTEMNLWVPKSAGNFLLAGELCCPELTW